MSAFRTAWHDLSNDAARAAYADLHTASPYGSVFTSLGFADAVGRAFDLEPRLVLACDADGVAQAGAAVYVKRTGPFGAAALPMYSKYVAPVLRSHPSVSDVHRRSTPLDVLLAAVLNRFDQVAFRLPPSYTDVRPFAWHGLDVWPEYQYDIPRAHLRPEAWRKDLRKAYRKARIAYAVERGPAVLDEVLRVERASMQRKELSPTPREALRSLTAHLIDQGLAEAFVARSHATGRVEAGVVVPRDDSRTYTWVMGSERGPGMTVLIGEVAREAETRGCPWLCLGGANVPSVAEYKRGFAPVLTPYYRVRGVTHPLLRLREAWHQLRPLR